MIKVLLKFLTTYFVLCQLLKIENLFLGFLYDGKFFPH